MSSSSNRNRLRLALEIQRNGCRATSACQRCSQFNRPCIFKPGSSLLRCAECVRQGKKCDNESWESLDRSRQEYEKKVSDDERLLAQVIQRLTHNKNLLRQIQGRAAFKTELLALEVEASGELETNDFSGFENEYDQDKLLSQLLADFQSQADMTSRE